MFRGVFPRNFINIIWKLRLIHLNGEISIIVVSFPYVCSNVIKSWMTCIRGVTCARGNLKLKLMRLIKKKKKKDLSTILIIENEFSYWKKYNIYTYIFFSIFSHLSCKTHALREVNARNKSPRSMANAARVESRWWSSTFPKSLVRFTNIFFF